MNFQRATIFYRGEEFGSSESCNPLAATRCCSFGPTFGGSGPSATTTNKTSSGQSKITGQSSIYTESGSIGLGKGSTYTEGGGLNLAKAIIGGDITFVLPTASQTAPAVGTSQSTLESTDGTSPATSAGTGSGINWQKWSVPIVAALILAFFLFRRR